MNKPKRGDAPDAADTPAADTSPQETASDQTPSEPAPGVPIAGDLPPPPADEPTHPAAGGCYVRGSDGSLLREED